MRKIITSLAALLAVGPSIQAQQQPVSEVPKLVVGITIDQLRGDYLQLFQNTFSERGFKRLLNEGLVYQNVTFDFPNVNDASAIATIYTGTNPAHHGIVSNKKFILEKEQELSVFTDDNYIGNYTQDKVSPKALKASTITDELKIASNGRSHVYSFAPSIEQSLITSGWAGNCAYWIDEYSGKWSSSTFYTDFHWIVDAENRSLTSHSNNAWGKTWVPALKRDAYSANPYGTNDVFQQRLGSDKNTYVLYKQTPYANESISDIANKLVEKADLGKRLSPDFLSLTFYAGRFQETNDYSLELQDTYTRLDKNIEQLLDNIEKTVGLKNTLIFVVSTGYYEPKADSDMKLELAGGTFFPNRCKALLNMYLMAIYGKNNQWVDNYYNGQIFLNRKLIKDRELSLSEIQQKAAQFVAEFSGVQEVYTLEEIRSGKWNPRIERYRNGINQAVAGDLFIELQPGVKVDKDENIGTSHQDNKYAVTAPVIFFGTDIKPRKVARGIKATDIAPSVTHILRIRPPNASADVVLPELMNQAR